MTQKHGGGRGEKGGEEHIFDDIACSRDDWLCARCSMLGLEEGRERKIEKKNGERPWVLIITSRKKEGKLTDVERLFVCKRVDSEFVKEWSF